MREERDEIRIRLYQNCLTQAWLINRLEERGIYTDKAELSSALAGTRKGAKVDKILSTAFEILKEYEDKMNNCNEALD